MQLEFMQQIASRHEPEPHTKAAMPPSNTAMAAAEVIKPPMATIPARPKPEPVSRKQVSTQTEHPVELQSAETRQTTQSASSGSQANDIKTAAVSDEQASSEPGETAITSHATAVAMPGNVQRMILTRITYPRRAQRKGWQGTATFHLDVREQKLAHLNLYHSSGHDILDHAAMRDISTVKQLPLANGLYALPVEFRLQ